MVVGVEQRGTADGTRRCTSSCCCGISVWILRASKRAGRWALFVTVSAYFGQEVGGIVGRLLSEQLPDGGWNCEAPKRSTRSSFNTTICVLEALLEHERGGPTHSS
jgi:hypothetical protein